MGVPQVHSRGSNSTVVNLLDSDAGGRLTRSFGPTVGSSGIRRYPIRSSGVFLLQSKVARHGGPDDDIPDVETPRRAPWRNPVVLRRGDGASAVLRIDPPARRDDGA